MLARRCIVGTGFRVFWSSSEAEGEVRMEDGGHVNVARITRGRVYK
jgi:hypothetical protein